MRNFLLLILTLYSLNSQAQSWSQLQKLVPNDREVNDEFGNSVAISGDFAIIGAMREDDNANNENSADDAGSAYIFQKLNGSWVQEAKLVAADRESHDFFGRDVDISGNYAIISAHQEGQIANTGAAYIFERNSGGTWVQVKKLEATVQKANDYFGFSVAIDGDYAVVGAYFEDEDGQEMNEVLSAGSAYVFKRNNSLNTWEFYQKIVAEDRWGDDRFGMSVDISGNHIIVGAEFDDVDKSDGLKSNAGSAYVFTKNASDEWVQEGHLTASDYGTSENFGWSVAISGEYAIVGAYKNDTDSDALNDSPDAGAAYIFERSGGTWPQVKKLVSSDRRNIDYFAYSVAISGDNALVGAYRHNYAGEGSAMFSDAGAAYLFTRDASGEWSETQKINQNDRATLDQFGYAVGIDGNDIIIGAMTEDEDENLDNPLPEAGAVYFFGAETTGTQQPNGKNFSLYPNPASQSVVIQLEAQEDFDLSVMDAQGRLMFQRQGFSSSAAELDLSGLEDGLYLLMIKTEQEFLGVKKLLIHR